MDIALDIGFVLASIGFLRKFNLSDVAVYGGALLGAVIVAELPQVYAAFPLVAPWIRPLVAAAGLWITAIGAPVLGTRAVKVFRTPGTLL